MPVITVHFNRHLPEKKIVHLGTIALREVNTLPNVTLGFTYLVRITRINLNVLNVQLACIVIEVACLRRLECAKKSTIVHRDKGLLGQRNISAHLDITVR